ncbi:MAG: hypothetical protein CLLPBCKN_002518 [Chroococcidiopsis cubana SAG 39.79]|jgi:hypothetical protein|uniref:Uncharacterized protein n=1 Tax=Chroococcidiopsis cubana SAG 39.79 TaxID=388085 RepID=A0AB37UCB8_9CYAN|nr:hypothetical protein [Chroococcidiopsis cubana SAG 39.79]PSB63144.1 hypothetical protein C7B79_15180 [Chroococcidiopsis cubana CCALA 043]RUT04536.1 hypothetical protein DSM107010_57680 [Chroococcidiopsis cubana SAG 39.79]
MLNYGFYVKVNFFDNNLRFKIQPNLGKITQIGIDLMAIAREFLLFFKFCSNLSFSSQIL